ncbi:MAG: hypothetical protein Q4P20_10280 [Eubacteriales bacterium]|nr:hypothetical protein [Eubacteriales bacterium]
MSNGHAKSRLAERAAQECNLKNAVYWGWRDPQRHIEKEQCIRAGVDYRLYQKYADGGVTVQEIAWCVKNGIDVAIFAAHRRRHATP